MSNAIPTCVSCFLIKKDQVLLLRRVSTDSLPGDFQMVSGKREGSEKLLSAVLREVAEETGLIPDRLYSADFVETFYVEKYDQIFFCAVFVGFIESDQVLRLSPQEHDKAIWVSFEKAYELLEFSGQKKALLHIVENFIQKKPKERFLMKTSKRSELQIETERLVLRTFIVEDHTALQAILGDKEVMRYSLHGALNEKQIKAFIQQEIDVFKEKGMSILAVVDKAHSRLVGYCGVHWLNIDGEILPELTYRFATKYWGLGFATEAAFAVKKYSMQKKKLLDLVSIIDPENFRSIRVAEKLGASIWKETLFEKMPIRVYQHQRKGKICK